MKLLIAILIYGSPYFLPMSSPEKEIQFYTPEQMRESFYSSEDVITVSDDLSKEKTDKIHEAWDNHLSSTH